ncbi:PREDICTED: pentatricopeptide repeat-containing protein At1g06140, mitochondrial-like isoform X2 [Tarenaya hassleriana]|uniref:pentatricopeptide repeat-containing protein At1g06140, mitochondrial-like isoform X1 n=1 Tax=Tarenaya hassleriana TaxID=28532 RepID=UPI00053C970F|nr:PREDICTED: pentatricopeptide repeat-containing protein At1g06140, mitochondrial-like isoform X1 [Tarenaya hassleriana]XP_010522447.1 PREDICTED: pentatricopeptide repeat-containing protein At1g06140, mitochondrial-like isoform X2 [Tarenaya hassleriana]
MLVGRRLKINGSDLSTFMFLRLSARAAIAFRSCSSTSELGSPFHLLHLLQLSSNHRSLRFVRQCHARTTSSGLTQNPFLATKLLSAYAVAGECGHMIESQLVFDSAREKSVFLWNSLINGYVKNCFYSSALGIFDQMCNVFCLLPDDFTLATVSKACAELGDLRTGRMVHSKSIQLGFISDMIVANSLLAMYSNGGQFGETRKVFDEMPNRNAGSWNVLISSYANLSSCNSDKDLWGIIRMMHIDGVKPDAYTLSTLLPLCNDNDQKWDYGREIHCYAVKNGLDFFVGSDVHLHCCLIHMYSKNKRLAVARRVFDRVRCKNVYIWTAIISGYVQNEDFEGALSLFLEMQVRDGIKPNKVSLVSLLPACSTLAGLFAGKQIHGFAIRNEIESDTPLCNALIDMYAKCGCLAYARRIFYDNSFMRDTISWSTMVSGYGLHGMAKEAIALFYEMLKLGHEPDMVTVVSVLSACGKSGLTNDGLAIYNLVTNSYGVRATPEMCSCLVDILGKSGRLDEALEFIRGMPVEAGPSVWGAFMSASVLHGNVEMQELAYRILLELEPDNPSNYVSLSNLYASLKRWDMVSKLRTTMKQREIIKTPGCSWISVNGRTHYFLVSDKEHLCSHWVYEMLDNLVSTMTGTGCSQEMENLADC